MAGKTYSASPPSGQTRRYFIEKYPTFLNTPTIQLRHARLLLRRRRRPLELGLHQFLNATELSSARSRDFDWSTHCRAHAVPKGRGGFRKALANPEAPLPAGRWASLSACGDHLKPANPGN